MRITKKIFEAATGDKPVQDDLERCNCKNSGKEGHFSCGWCMCGSHNGSQLGHPKFMGCPKTKQG